MRAEMCPPCVLTLHSFKMVPNQKSDLMSYITCADVYVPLRIAARAENNIPDQFFVTETVLRQLTLPLSNCLRGK